VINLGQCTPRDLNVQKRMPFIIDCQNTKVASYVHMKKFKLSFDYIHRNDTEYKAVDLTGDKRNAVEEEIIPVNVFEDLDLYPQTLKKKSKIGARK
jgi:hypothetical protein